MFIRPIAKTQGDEKTYSKGINALKKNYKNEAGYYSIPRDTWQILSESDISFVKSFNGMLCKELQSNTTKISQKEIRDL